MASSEVRASPTKKMDHQQPPAVTAGYFNTPLLKTDRRLYIYSGLSICSKSASRLARGGSTGGEGPGGRDPPNEDVPPFWHSLPRLSLK